MIDRTSHSNAATIPEPALYELRFRLRGGFHEPGDPGYVDAWQPALRPPPSRSPERHDNNYGGRP